MVVVLLCLSWSALFYFWTLRERPSLSLEDLQAEGVLQVAAVEIPGRLVHREGEWQGIEYDLVSGFAASLGLRVLLHPVDGPNEALNMLLNRKVHVVVSGINHRLAARHNIPLTEPIRKINLEIAYQRSQLRPRTIAHLRKHEPTVIAGSVEAEKLARMKSRFPWLKWRERSDIGVEELLTSVGLGEIETTLAGADSISITRLYVPRLQVAFALDEPLELFWGFALQTDPELVQLANQFINEVRSRGDLYEIVDKHLGPTQTPNFVDMRNFHNKARNTLPGYRKLFQDAAQDNGLDWRLIAAVAYQESHWNPDAKSETGVQGFMQITRVTAETLGVTDVTDPVEAVKGGSRYIATLLKRIPPEVPHPDRLWFALAAYNVGFGHLVDARKLATEDDSNPDRWSDVRRFLPLLQLRRWFSQTDHGHARGHQAVAFVGQVRRFYKILIHLYPE